jgi:hypothetical protein
MSHQKKKRFKASGTFIERELLISMAYWALTSTAKGMLSLFLLKRNFDNQKNLLNRKNITMTYKELENLFNSNTSSIAGVELFGNERKGLSRGAITSGFKDLLAKGFIEIIKQGGACQKEKTIYGLSEDWRLWREGSIIREKPIGKSAGYSTFKKNKQHAREPYTPHAREPKAGI